MATIETPWHQTIRTAITQRSDSLDVTQRPDATLDVSIALWERLAAELIAIIGEGGVQALYSRSIHITRATFPWIVISHPWQRTESRFLELKVSFSRRNDAEVSEASIALLVTFVDLLASLV